MLLSTLVKSIRYKAAINQSTFKSLTAISYYSIRSTPSSTQPIAPISAKSNLQLKLQQTQSETSFTTNNQSNESQVPSPHQPCNSVSNEEKRMVYCHALPNDWDEIRLRKYFDPTSKNINQITLLKNRIGGYTGRALIEFNNAKIAEQYLQKYSDSFIETTDVLQRIIMKPFELKTKRTRLQAEKTMREVYLANLPYQVTSDEIYAIAEDFGEVQFIDMPLAFDGNKNRGYCIVKFTTPQEAAKFQRYFEEETLYGRKIRAQIHYYEFDTQKKRVERLSDKFIKEDPSIKNANLRANKELFKSLQQE